MGESRTGSQSRRLARNVASGQSPLARILLPLHPSRRTLPLHRRSRPIQPFPPPLLYSAITSVGSTGSSTQFHVLGRLSQ